MYVDNSCHIHEEKDVRFNLWALAGDPNAVILNIGHDRQGFSVIANPGQLMELRNAITAFLTPAAPPVEVTAKVMAAHVAAAAEALL